MKKFNLLLYAVLLLALVQPASAQYKDQGGFGGGIGFGGNYGRTDLTSGGAFNARAYLRKSFVHGLQGELGVSLGRISGDAYETQLVPIDFRLLLHPLSSESWNPYLYAGIGAMYFDIRTLPPNPTPDVKTTDWTGVVPLGLGLQFPLSNQASFEISGGYNMTFSKSLEAIKGSKNDAFWTFLAGLSISGESGSADPDGDGLTNDEEKELGTDPRKADTDGDGLTDGEEVHKYHTDPKKSDSDGDGLSDGDEVHKYGTDPNKADTDGDGLSDGDEINKYHTDPLKVDTDGDGLSDGDEILKYHTDPLKVDTDGDGLSDYDEVMKYHTDPLKVDTDGGSVPDGVEVNRGTNPLDPNDDVPKVKVEVGKAIVLEGVTFKTGSATLTPESEKTLDTAYQAMKANPTVEVEVRGYTDNVGKKAANVKLSQKRAESVKDWLVKKGIDPSRITAKGYGPENPIDTNKTDAGRAKNRRIEFYRTK